MLLAVQIVKPTEAMWLGLWVNRKDCIDLIWFVGPLGGDKVYVDNTSISAMNILRYYPKWRCKLILRPSITYKKLTLVLIRHEKLLLLHQLIRFKNNEDVQTRGDDLHHFLNAPFYMSSWYTEENLFSSELKRLLCENKRPKHRESVFMGTRSGLCKRIEIRGPRQWCMEIIISPELSDVK